jgi:hypothetical protein
LLKNNVGKVTKSPQMPTPVGIGIVYGNRHTNDAGKRIDAKWEKGSLRFVSPSRLRQGAESAANLLPHFFSDPGRKIYPTLCTFFHLQQFQNGIRFCGPIIGCAKRRPVVEKNDEFSRLPAAIGRGAPAKITFSNEPLVWHGVG